MGRVLPASRRAVLVSDFDFHLPDELVAQDPVARGDSRLLVLERDTGALHHLMIGNLPAQLHRGDVLVVNDTRVFPARLLGRREPSGGGVECLLLHRVAPPAGDPAEDAHVQHWSALVHPGQKLKPGARVRFAGPAGSLTAEILGRHFHGRRTIRLMSDSVRPVEELIDALGHVPLPPYIKRADRQEDRERYQTVYAAHRGSVAAPTAGLHFTPELLDRLARVGVQRAALTLHVGYGTFKPVRTANVEDHSVDPEEYTIPSAAAAAIAAAKAERRRVVAVGTTTVRALEDSAAKHEGRIAAGRDVATLFIYPGFTFRVVDALLTNFHLPHSSLLMLVAAFAGREKVLEAYREAIERRYRFYSYGDAMLIV